MPWQVAGNLITTQGIVVGSVVEAGGRWNVEILFPPRDIHGQFESRERAIEFIDLIAKMFGDPP